MSVDDFDICGASWTIEDHDDFVGERLQFDFWLSSNDFIIIMVLLFTFSFMGRLIELWYLSALHRIQESNIGRRISASRASVSTVSRSPTMHEANDEIQYENSTAGIEKALHEAAEHDIVVPSWMNYFCLWSWSLFFMTVSSIVVSRITITVTLLQRFIQFFLIFIYFSPPPFLIKILLIVIYILQVIFCISLGTIKFNYFIGLLFGCVFDVIFSTSVTIFIYKQRARRKYPGLVFLLFCVWFIVPFNIFMLLGCSYVYEFSRAVALLCTGVSSWFSAGVFYRRWSAVVSPDRRAPGYMCCECHACLGWDAALDEHLPLIRQHDGKENEDDDMLYSPSFNYEPSFTGPPTIRYTKSPGVALVGHNLSAPQTPTPTHNQLKQMAASTPTSQSTPKSFTVLSNPSPNIIETINNKIPPSSSSFTSLNSDPPPIFISSTTPPHSRRASVGALLSSTTTTPPSLSTTSSVPLLPSNTATQTNLNSNPNNIPEVSLDSSVLIEMPITQSSNGTAVRLDEKHTGLLRSSRSPSSQSASSSSSSSSFGISISSSHLPSSASSSSFSAVLPTLPTT